MIKKLLVAAVIGAVAFGALKGTKFFGYAKSEVASIGEWVDSNIPPEKKIAALRKEVKHLDRDIDRTCDELAKEIVEVDHLNKDLVALRTEVTIEEKKVRALALKLTDATEKVVYGREMVPVEEAKYRLNRDVKLIVSRKNTVEGMEQTLVSRERIKESLVKQVEALRRNKQDLAVSIDKLEAEYKTLQLQQIESKYQVDDTRLAQIKQTIRELQKDVDVKRQKLKMAPSLAEDGAPVTALSVDDILAPLDGSKKSEKKTD